MEQTAPAVAIASLVTATSMPNFTQALAVSPAFAATTYASVAELVPQLRGPGAFLVFFPLTSGEDLTQLALLVRETRKAPATVKIVVVVRVGAGFDGPLAKLGLVDFVDPGATAKVLRYKIEFWLKGFGAQLKASTPKGVLKQRSPAAVKSPASEKAPAPEPEPVVRAPGEAPGVEKKWDWNPGLYQHPEAVAEKGPTAPVSLRCEPALPERTGPAEQERAAGGLGEPPEAASEVRAARDASALSLSGSPSGEVPAAGSRAGRPEGEGLPQLKKLLAKGRRQYRNS
jgi:hypothetical protein